MAKKHHSHHKGNCKVLLARLRKKQSKHQRGKALGAYAKAGCAKRRHGKHHHKAHHLTETIKIEE